MSRYFRARHGAGLSHAYYVGVPGSPQLTQCYDVNVEEITAGPTGWIAIPPVLVVELRHPHARPRR